MKSDPEHRGIGTHTEGEAGPDAIDPSVLPPCPLCGTIHERKAYPRLDVVLEICPAADAVYVLPR